LASAEERGIVTVKSRYSFLDTLGRLESLVKSHGLITFAVIDFTGDAEKAGLSMLPTRLLVFGNPSSGTPVIVASPTSALDLPLKVLTR